MPKQPRLIDADKLYDWLYGNGYHEICEEIRLREGAGSFSPTPPVQPDTPDPGDKVRHKEHAYKKYGIGVVKEISKSGKQAYVEWPNFDRALCSYAPSPSYYRLDKLEVITDDSST